MARDDSYLDSAKSGGVGRRRSPPVDACGRAFASSIVGQLEGDRAGSCGFTSKRAATFPGAASGPAYLPGPRDRDRRGVEHLIRGAADPLPVQRSAAAARLSKKTWTSRDISCPICEMRESEDPSTDARRRIHATNSKRAAGACSLVTPIRLRVILTTGRQILLITPRLRSLPSRSPFLRGSCFQPARAGRRDIRNG